MVLMTTVGRTDYFECVPCHRHRQVRRRA